MVCIVSYSPSALCIHLRESMIRSMERVFGVPSFSIVTVCVWTLRVLYGADAHSIS